MRILSRVEGEFATQAVPAGGASCGDGEEEEGDSTMKLLKHCSNNAAVALASTDICLLKFDKQG